MSVINVVVRILGSQLWGEPWRLVNLLFFLQLGKLRSSQVSAVLTLLLLEDLCLNMMTSITCLASSHHPLFTGMILLFR